MSGRAYGKDEDGMSTFSLGERWIVNIDSRGVIKCVCFLQDVCQVVSTLR